jgi:V8-like Glu-specific endopeptidase
VDHDRKVDFALAGWRYDVLTAAHCVYSTERSSWAASIEVTPGLDETVKPYGHAWATILRTFTEFTTNGNTRYDMAVVTLDRNIGMYTGWMGRKVLPSDSPELTGILNLAGYPVDKTFGTMWFDADNGHSADDTIHWYSMDTAGGHSGSPVWTYTASPQTWFVITVHTCGTPGCGIDGKSVNHGTRLNTDKYNTVETWRTSDTAPTDRADLVDDGQDYAGFSPLEVKPGSTSFQVWSDVRNMGTGSSGSFKVYYYASPNTTISTSDWGIGNFTLSSIPPFSYGGVNLGVTFPSGVADGLYWVGWIIDKDNTVVEFDESNNIAYKQAYQVLVDGTAPTNPTSVSESGGAANNTWQNSVSDPNFTWSGASDGSGSGVHHYNYYWGTSSSGTSTNQLTSPGYNPPAVSSPSTNYLRVNTIDEVGNQAAWTTLFTFRYDATAPSNPTSASETHGVQNNTWQTAVNNPSFTWSGASDGSGSGVSRYYVYFGPYPLGTSSNYVTSPAYTPPAVSAPGIYFLRVRTQDAAGNNSAWTGLFTFKFGDLIFFPLLIR